MKVYHKDLPDCLGEISEFNKTEIKQLLDNKNIESNNILAIWNTRKTVLLKTKDISSGLELRTHKI